MVETPATWKKLSAVSQSSAQPGDMKVMIERSYHLQDEDETEVEHDNLAKGGRALNSCCVCVTFSLV